MYCYCYREQPPIERFEFDGSLLYAPCAPSNVTAGQVVVNNLTHDYLTERYTCMYIIMYIVYLSKQSI